MSSPLQLLILEGSTVDAELAVTALERASYSCAWDQVQTRNDLVAQLDRHRYDLILADYRLPDLDGLSALHLVRERGIDIPFIVCCEHIGTEALTEVLRAGATDYLSKTKLDRLPSVVARALKERDERRQRWQADEALRQSERRYAAFMRNLPSVAFMKDLHGRYVYVNEAVQHLARVAPRDWLGRTDHELWPAAATAASAWHGDERRRAVLAGGKAQLSVQTVPRPDGSHYWCNLEFPIPQDDGIPAMTGGVAVDMTESRRQETICAALLEVATQIQGTLDLGEVLDRVHRCVLPLLPCDRVLTLGWNPSRGAFDVLAANGVAEWPPDSDGLEIIPPELVATWARFGRPLANGNGGPRAQAPRAGARRFGGTAFLSAPLEVRGAVGGVMVAVREGGGGQFEAHTVQLFERIVQQVAAAMTTIDLYCAKDEEAQLNAALADVGYQLIAGGNSMDLLDRLCRVTTRVLSCCRSYTALWEPNEEAYVPVASHGYTAEEREALRTLKLPRTQLGDMLARLERHGVVPVAPSESEALAPLTTTSPVGRSLWMALRRGREVEGIHIATFDKPMADLPRHHERLGHELATLASLAIENIRLVEELRHANQLKSDFVATMSHELRSPLNSILGYTDLVLESAFGPVTVEQERVLRCVNKSGRQLLDLVNATLDVSRLDAGTLPVHVLPIVVAELLEEIEADTRETRQESGLRFVWDVPEGLPPVETDRVKLKVVVMNLISNAIKFTPNGTVTVTARGRDQGIEIAVADTGVGVGPDVLSVIFEPFRQGDSSSTRGFGGVGLGLYIVRRLLDLLGGTIDVESEVGEGSKFRVYVPRTTAPRQREKLDALAPRRETVLLERRA